MRDELAFNTDIRPIVQNFCTTCHAGADPRAGIALTSYDEVKKHVRESGLLDRINDANRPMPPSGLMPTYMRRMIRIWSDTGFKENGVQRAGETPVVDYGDFTPPAIVPVDIRKQPLGFELLGNMQGHWVGSMWLMGEDFEWMAFDFRPIAPSHIHGIFEGGTIGNLFTSFFVTRFNGKRTIMARNGGILNGIYRTSYFVLDTAELRTNPETGKEEAYYRLVDAYGGANIMYMELIFGEEALNFNAYTSRMGLNAPAKPHMSFRAQRMHPELSTRVAKKLGFPKNVIDKDFSRGLPKPDWGSDEIPQTSASYLWEEPGLTLEQLGKRAKDPYRINEMPYLSRLTVKARRNRTIKDKPLMIYLSGKPLTDSNGKFVTEHGYLPAVEGNSLLMFPEVTGDTDEFTFTYLHPGEYFLTVIADMNGDSMPTPGDVSSASKKISVKPTSHPTVRVDAIRTQN